MEPIERDVFVRRVQVHREHDDTRDCATVELGRTLQVGQPDVGERARPIASNVVEVDQDQL